MTPQRQNTKSHIPVVAMDEAATPPQHQGQQHRWDSRSLFDLPRKHIRALTPARLRSWTAVCSIFPGYLGLQLGAPSMERT